MLTVLLIAVHEAYSQMPLTSLLQPPQLITASNTVHLQMLSDSKPSLTGVPPPSAICPHVLPTGVHMHLLQSLPLQLAAGAADAGNESIAMKALHWHWQHPHLLPC